MVLKPSSINDHLEEGSDSIQVDQICDELVGLRSNHEILEPREVSMARLPNVSTTTNAHEGITIHNKLVVGQKQEHLCE